MPSSAKPTANTTIHRPARRHPIDRLLYDMSVRFIVELLCHVSKKTCGQLLGVPHRCVSGIGRASRSLLRKSPAITRGCKSRREEPSSLELAFRYRGKNYGLYQVPDFRSMVVVSITLAPSGVV